MYRRTAHLDGVIRRQILTVLAGSEDITIPSATALVADDWGSRREQLGDSPAAVTTATAMVFQVGAELAAEEPTELIAA